MNRRNPAFQHIDLDVWPSVDSGALSPDKAAFFKRRRQAIDAYVSGASLRNIEEECAVRFMRICWKHNVVFVESRPLII